MHSLGNTPALTTVHPRAHALASCCAGTAHTWQNIEGHTCGRWKDELDRKQSEAVGVLGSLWSLGGLGGGAFVARVGRLGPRSPGGAAWDACALCHIMQNRLQGHNVGTAGPLLEPSCRACRKACMWHPATRYPELCPRTPLFTAHNKLGFFPAGHDPQALHALL